MSLDPDDARPPYLQVAHALRAAILTGTYNPGDQLPSGHELATQYGVARMTITNAIDVLRNDGLVVSRKGSGVYVRERTERPVGLRPHIERAFESPRVTIDFAGFSGETLHGAIQEPIDKIRAGRFVPESIRVRVLLADTERPMSLPCRVEDLEDDPGFRKRAAGITKRHAGEMDKALRDLGKRGLVKEINVQIRVHRCAPLFKLYILNNEQAFYGFYPVARRDIEIAGEDHEVFDLVGKDATLFHYTADDGEGSTGAEYVQQARTWFDSMWTTISYEPA